MFLRSERVWCVQNTQFPYLGPSKQGSYGVELCLNAWMISQNLSLQIATGWQQEEKEEIYLITKIYTIEIYYMILLYVDTNWIKKPWIISEHYSKGKNFFSHSCKISTQRILPALLISSCNLAPYMLVNFCVSNLLCG